RRLDLHAPRPRSQLDDRHADLQRGLLERHPARRQQPPARERLPLEPLAPLLLPRLHPSRLHAVTSRHSAPSRHDGARRACTSQRVSFWRPRRRPVERAGARPPPPSPCPVTPSRPSSRARQSTSLSTIAGEN